MTYNSVFSFSVLFIHTKEQKYADYVIWKRYFFKKKLRLILLFLVRIYYFKFCTQLLAKCLT